VRGKRRKPRKKEGSDLNDHPHEGKKNLYLVSNPGRKEEKLNMVLGKRERRKGEFKK